MGALDDREARLRRGDELWEQLRAALDAHLREPLGPATDWTGHDVYAHFARWTEKTLEGARAVLAGTYRPPVHEANEDELNMRWRDEDRTLPTDEARTRSIEARDSLRALLMGLSEQQWTAWGHLFTPDIDGEHYEHHLAMLGAEAR